MKENEIAFPFEPKFHSDYKSQSELTKRLRPLRS